jgi:aryl-alcohol dehydrogenase-like predicted oxidoreductase
MASSFLPDDKFLQAGLSSGMSATAGWHSSKPNPVPPELAGKNILPMSYCPGPKDRINLASTKGPVKVAPICIGAWPWGDKATFDWSEDELPAVKKAWKLLYDSGLNFIDTAAAYGDGRSEQIVGELVRGLPRDSYVIQTKWLGLPTAPNNVIHPVDAVPFELQASLKRLGLDYVDIYLVHGPIHPQPISSVAAGLAKCVEQGMTKAVGVANYSTEELKLMQAELIKHNVPLATQQVEFSILRRLPETNGMIAECQARNIVFQSYSSLAQGRLTGKYTPENPPPKTHKFSNYPMEDIEPTLKVLRDVADKRGKSMASVALNWNISKGALPLVGIRNEQHARDAVEALGWRLTEEEVTALDRVSVLGNTTKMWQRG